MTRSAPTSDEAARAGVTVWAVKARELLAAGSVDRHVTKYASRVRATTGPMPGTDVRMSSLAR